MIECTLATGSMSVRLSGAGVKSDHCRIMQFSPSGSIVRLISYKIMQTGDRSAISLMSTENNFNF